MDVALTCWQPVTNELGGQIDEAVGFAEGEVPGVAGDEVAASVRLVGLDAAGAKENVHAFAA
jgi:hypothetical protein